MLLHTVNKSPFEKNSLDTCLRLSAPGSCILLIEDGVYGALAAGAHAAKLQDAMLTRKLYALEADLKARGITPSRLIAGIEVVDYHGFVELAASCAQVQSWF